MIMSISSNGSTAMSRLKLHHLAHFPNQDVTTKITIILLLNFWEFIYLGNLDLKQIIPQSKPEKYVRDC